MGRKLKKLLREVQQTSKTDPMGSYTGRPEDPHEIPVQDADDL